MLFESFYYLAPLTAIPGPSPCLCSSCCLCQFLQIFLNNFLDKKLSFYCPIALRYECVCVCVCVRVCARARACVCVCVAVVDICMFKEFLSI